MSYFYKTGVDITNDKQMFNFLQNHKTYWTLSSWNGLESIANDVKMYHLDLTGDWWVALKLLELGEYDTISMLIHDWERAHHGFEVQFNGRCGGYLVLTSKGSNSHVLPQAVCECGDYEEYKRYCKEFFGSVKANRDELVEYTKLVQSFDKLCDQLRDFCDQLSRQAFEIVEMQRAVDEFNEAYGDDLEYLEFQYLKCDNQGVVDILEICQLECLKEAFYRIAKRTDEGYGFEHLPEWRIRYKKL